MAPRQTPVPAKLGFRDGITMQRQENAPSSSKEAVRATKTLFDSDWLTAMKAQSFLLVSCLLEPFKPLDET